MSDDLMIPTFLDRRAASGQVVEPALVPEPPDKARQALAEHANAIRTLGKRVVADVVEIGRHLIQARDLCGHGNWLAWLSQEFGWSEDTALNFMHCHELAKSRDFRDLSLPVSGLYLLAQPSTPEPVRQELFDRTADGERLSVVQIKKTIAKARNPPSYTSDPPPNHKQIAAGLTLARQMNLATLDQFMVGLRQIRREKKRG